MSTEYVALRKDAVLDLVKREARRGNLTVGAFCRTKMKGVSRPYLYALVNGDRSCSRATARKIADALDVALSTIADEIPAPAAEPEKAAA